MTACRTPTNEAFSMDVTLIAATAATVNKTVLIRRKVNQLANNIIMLLLVLEASKRGQLLLTKLYHSA